MAQKDVVCVPGNAGKRANIPKVNNYTRVLPS